MSKLPGILALFEELLREKNGLRNLETVLRYLSSAVENITPDDIQTLIKKSLSEVKEDIVMTIIEKWIDEGYQKGVRQGVQEGLTEGIVLAVNLKFGPGPESDKLIEMIKNVKEVDRLKALKDAILKVSTVPELMHILGN